MKIKFCGITNIEDAKNAIALGVDYLGFIIDFPKSPRSVAMDEFIKLAKQIKKLKLLEKKIPRIVAVTVNMPEDKLNELLNTNLIDILQFHGNETPEFCERFKRRIEVWKSFKIKKTENRKQKTEILNNFKRELDRFLLDAASADDKAKGAVKKFNNFSLFKNFEQAGYPLVLAGGINPDNVKLYIEKLNPEIIDVASGIEEYPGKKSREKMTQLIKKINNQSDGK